MADRRVRRTQKALQGALVQLLQVKELSSITVKELCCAADVNKSTFYLHYRDIYDCASCLNENVVEKMEFMIAPYDGMQMRTELASLLESALTVYKQNRELIQPFLKNASLASVTHGIRGAVTRRAQQLGTPEEYADPGFRVCVAFIVCGLFGIIEQADDADIDHETVRRVAGMIQDGFLNRQTVK